ncbi:hypothetical protein [Nocardioides plantarum]|uniref:Uncharacterized protein n=1 Tax=Nocardioides plantarum TaxID=29299 RepID=A0ABV5KDC5_9ACTN|nr:hypothetical protein [Nocardioides plantarum]
MALLHTISSVVRLPLHLAVKTVGTVAGLVPGHGAKAAPAPTDVKSPAAPATPVAEPVAKPAAKGPVTPASAGPTPDPAAPAPRAPARKPPAKKAPAKKAPAATVAEPATKAPAADPVAPAPAKKSAAGAAKKAVPATKAAAPAPEPEPTPVTAIDAEALDDEVDVTPADIARSMGSQLDDRPPSPS